MGAGAIFCLSGCSRLAEPGGSAGRLAAPVNLRCEYGVNPLGIDEPGPRLSWEVNDPRRGAVQSAYQIVVTEQAGGVVWDTGKVDSDQSVHVSYRGRPPQSGRRYYWKVRTWDGGGAAGEFSAPAWWEMGLLDGRDWTGRWITVEKTEAKPTQCSLINSKWIWNQKALAEQVPPELSSKDDYLVFVYFRHKFRFDGDEQVQRAVLRACSDQRFDVWINGQKTAHGYRTGTGYRTYIATTRLKPGANVIAACATHLSNPRGLIMSLEIQTVGGKTIIIPTDENWRTSGREHAGWTEPDFDDSAWEPAAVLANYGTEPRWRLTDALLHRPSYYLRKEFKVSKPVARARVYVTGLGFYRLHVNGRRVGEDIFTPDWTDYPKRVQYQTYDVTELLRPGDNAVGAMLGNGWYSGDKLYQFRDAGRRSLRLLMQMNIAYADGTSDRVVTDGTWKMHRSPVLRDSIFNGETYDARREIAGWAGPGLDERAWQPVVETDLPGARLVAQQCENIRITAELKARQIVKLEGRPDAYLFDFGQNMAGWVRLKVRGPRGTQVRLRFAELVNPGGGIYTDNLRSAEATDYYILKGEGEEVWEPRFTYHGFRYCAVSGYPGTPTDESLVACAVHSAVPPAGTFACSNWLLNRINECIVWGQRSNLHSVPTDCPQRDERMGWTGDAQVFARTACWNMQMVRLFGKWERDMLDAREPQEGWITDVAPTLGRWPARPGWGDAIVIMPWMLYQFYGDKRIIEESYQGMADWVEYMHKRSKNHLYEPRYEPFGDWIAPVATPKKPIADAYYYYSTRLLAAMAELIGKNDDARRYAAEADMISEAFNCTHLDFQKNAYPGNTQTANLLPLCFGITPPERRSAVARNIVQDVRARGEHLSTGFLGTPLLLPTLTEYGEHELAYRLATQTTCPSWGYMVTQGASTIWELWDADLQNPSMNSRNHFALGAVGQWFYEALAGINIDLRQPGFKRMIIRPRPAGDLLWVRAEYASLYGPIASAWQLTAEGIILDLRIPPNTSAAVHVPTLGKANVRIAESGVVLYAAGRPKETAPGITFARLERDCVIFEVGAGRYRFEMKGP